MGKKSSPPAPDYGAAAAQQAQSSKEVTNMQTWANRPDQVTPWGSTSWTPSSQVDPATGQNVTKWTQTTKLDPRAQGALDDQFAIQSGRSAGAKDLLSQASNNFQKPIDWNSFTPTYTPGNREGQVQTSVAGPSGDIRDKAQEAVWQRQQPAFQQQRDASLTRLANMGITPGSEQYNREMNRLDFSENQGRLAAIESGRAEAGQDFGQNLARGQFANQATQLQQGLGEEFGRFSGQQRQQQIAEEQTRRAQTLNELNALLTGQQVNMPGMPNFQSAQRSEGLQSLNAAQLGYQANLDAFNSQQQGLGSTIGGLAQIGGTAAMFMSDPDLKHDVIKLGTTKGGLGIYEYTIGNNREVGVMADEVEALYPEAVHYHPSGYRMVNYAAIH